MAEKKKKKKKTMRATVLSNLRNKTTTNKKGKTVKVYKAASKKAKKKNKNYKTAKKYNKYYQMKDCTVLKNFNGTPENDQEQLNKLLEIDKEVETMIADLKNLTQKGDTNLATIKAGINGLMKNELNAVSFNVGGTAPLYEMIYHIDENLDNHIKTNSFSSFKTDFIKAAKKHAQIEADYVQEFTKQVYKRMKNNLKEAEVKYNKYAEDNKKNSDIAQNYRIPEDGKWSDRFKLVSGKDTPVANRDSYTLLEENKYGTTVSSRNKKKKNYSPIRKKAKQLNGTINTGVAATVNKVNQTPTATGYTSANTTTTTTNATTSTSSSSTTTTPTGYVVIN